jgi:hypothetical protein
MHQSANYHPTRTRVRLTHSSGISSAFLGASVLHSLPSSFIQKGACNLMDDRPPKFGQRSQCTWVSQAETPAIIKQFLVHYSRGHYSSLAHRAKELTEEELSKPEWHDVHVNIISRAKTPKSLEEKLKMRHTVHPYEHENDIWVRSASYTVAHETMRPTLNIHSAG